MAKNFELLKRFHLKVRSEKKNNTAVLECLFSEFGIPFDIIMLSESWYHNLTGMFKLPQYITFCANPDRGRGGGV